MNHELSAAHGHMSLRCASENLDDFARFFGKQEGEEREQARKIMDHLHDRGALPEVQAVAVSDQKYDSLLQVALPGEAMERANTKGGYAVYEAALAAKDYPALVLMHWFINEQVEEEAWRAELVDRVRQATCAGITRLNRTSRRICRRRRQVTIPGASPDAFGAWKRDYQPRLQPEGHREFPAVGGRSHGTKRTRCNFPGGSRVMEMSVTILQSNSP